MPKLGKKIKIGDENFLVKRQNPLQESIVVSNEKGEDTLLQKDEWRLSEPSKVEKNEKAEKAVKNEKKAREE